MDRTLIAVIALALAGCNPTPKPIEKPDPTKQPWYRNAVEELVRLHRDAAALQTKDPDQASALILQAQPIISQVLGAPKPTLQAVELASDFDDLYGRMLLRNRHYGSARMTFQKNVARWKNRRPETQETARRLKVAQDAIDECDRLIDKQNR